jgi:hypothetical protein
MGDAATATSADVTEKQCSLCKSAKPITDFHRTRAANDGHHHRCKACYREARLQLVASGVCSAGCGRPRDGKRLTCSGCTALARSAARRLYRQRRSQGLCGLCGGTVEAGRGATCAGCSDKQRAQRRRATEDGRCLKCFTRPKLPDHQQCESCWFKRQAHKHLGSTTRSSDLRSIWLRQKGLCALSGERLVPGLNASVDHVVPRSLGGTDEASNLRWVETTVNQARSNMSDEAFVAMCRRVVDHAGAARS